MVRSLRDLLSLLSEATTNRSESSLLRRKVSGFSTDSRSLKTYQAFVALRGESFNGHDFVERAFKQGASVALVEQSYLDKHGRTASGILVGVDDTLAAYGAVARAHRDTFAIPIVAVAGSNGKTTTKELIADLLSQRYNVLRTQGNLNNLIGVPATLLRLNQEHTAAVVEVGTNTPGEIAQLCELVNPTHGLITSIGREHLELLGSIEGVASEEGGLFDYLAAHNGIPIVWLDDPHIARMGRRLPNRVSYGRSSRADISGRIGGLDPTGAPSLVVTDRRRTAPRVMELQLRTPGRHTANNGLAAAATALALGVAMSKVKRTLEAFTPTVSPSGYARLAAMRATNGAVILNDTYNANPDSVVVALETLAAIKPPSGGIRIAVLADMLELGRSSKSEHRRVAEEIARIGSIDLILFYGTEMRSAFLALRRIEGATKRPPLHFTDKAKLIDTLDAFLAPEDVVLVKGSRGMTMETVVMAIME